MALAAQSASPLRGDRWHRQLKPGGHAVRFRHDGWEDGPARWCIYGCPTNPYELVDYGDVRILWGTCEHPIDLSVGAHLRHAAAYAKGERR